MHVAARVLRAACCGVVVESRDLFEFLNVHAESRGRVGES